MGKDAPLGAFHDDDEPAAFAPAIVRKITPSVPASQAERPQLRPVMTPPIGEQSSLAPTVGRRVA